MKKTDHLVGPGCGVEFLVLMDPIFHFDVTFIQTSCERISVFGLRRIFSDSIRCRIVFLSLTKAPASRTEAREAGLGVIRCPDTLRAPPWQTLPRSWRNHVP